MNSLSGVYLLWPTGELSTDRRMAFFSAKKILSIVFKAFLSATTKYTF